ncbi:MAG: PBP1A family penicillin-binding protein [Patescibacteria group bacterium]|mgnify:FL=1
MSKKIKRKKLIKTLLGVIAFLFALFVFTAVVVVFWVATLKIPDAESLNDLKVAQSTKIYDRTGKIILWDIHDEIQRTLAPLEEISRHIKNATVAIEDSSFYQHRGIDITGILRAILVNLKSGHLSQGGSTISQQLVKNTLLTTDKTFTRKIKEIILTLKIEKKLSKDKILELYLNEVPYGGSNYGVESASRNFFGKNASDIDLAEASYLASLTKAPTYYSPYGTHQKELENRKDLVLNKMTELGFITKDEAETAKKEKVVFINKGQNSIKAAHFSIYIRSYLEEKYGKDVVEQGGLKVTTTINYPLQQKAEEIALRYAKENKEKFNASNNSIVAIDPKTGQILVMVGSKDYFNQEDQGNFNVALAHRQPGSAIKPFIYAEAFKKGYSPDTVIFDVQTEFNPTCLYVYNYNASNTPETLEDMRKKDQCYMPENYDLNYRGPINLRNALAQSVNIPAVKTLYLAGINDSIDLMKNMGITSLTEPDRYGLTLVLGGGEVSLLELTGAYSVFANNGSRNAPVGILKIEDKSGNILEEYQEDSKQVLDKNIALMISDVLSDNKARTPAFGANSPLYFHDRQVAVKTGTTNDYKDAWVVGYTPNISVGAWFGNNNNSSMEKMVAGFIVAPMWNEFMTEIFKEIQKEDFEKPKKIKGDKPVLNGEWMGGKTYLVDSFSGKIATEFTPPELIKEKVLTQIHSILYWVDKDNIKGNKPSNPENDSQFKMWEIPVRKWVESANIKDQTDNDIPKEKDDIHLPEYAPVISFESPIENQTYDSSSAVIIKISHQSKFGLSQIDYYFNNNYLGSLNQEPYVFTFKPSSFNINENDSEIKIITYDKVRNKTEKKILIKINR